MTPRYHYCTQQMPAPGVWVLVWFSVEDVPAAGTTALVWVWWLHRDVAATWDGAAWRDGDGAVLADVLCWRVG